MRVLLASSEVYPFSKTGGLADMVGALGKALWQAGNEVGVITPLYRGILDRFPDISKFDWRIELPLAGKQERAQVWIRAVDPRYRTYFIDHPGFFDRKGIYQEAGSDYPDNAERFIFFAKAATQMARYLPWQPEIVHSHDWPAGLVPLFIRHQEQHEGWSGAPRTCLTIHNLAYQGIFPGSAYQLTNLPPDYFQPDGVEFYKLVNCLKAGIVYSDVMTTVSPRYAREIRTEAFGCGLDGVLRARGKKLVGILNGVDTEEWNTRKNPHLRQSYSWRDLSGKQTQKLDLQKELGLPIEARIPLFGTVTRLVDQKGSDIQLGALEEMLATNMQFVLLGSGDPVYERAYLDLAARYPHKVSVRIDYDHGLSHRIEAGSDFYLMPSRFEPCGLNQLYSLLYGTIPIVRVTGGLDDSVIDLSEDLQRANGIKFTEYSFRALAKAIRKALQLYQHPQLMRRLQRNGMRLDFSWRRTIEEYIEVYRKGLGGGKPAAEEEVEEEQETAVDQEAALG